MLLMYRDIPTLYYNLDNMELHILNNQLLPFSLRDFIKDIPSINISLSDSLKYLSALRDFLACRVLNLSRENAKAILRTAGFPQSLKTEDKIKITEACRGLSMSDSYWLKEDMEEIKFADVNLRKKSLSDAAFQISIEGHILSISRDILIPDIGTQGMFAKTWHRNKDGITELWKTDKTGDCSCTKAELQMSNILDKIGTKHVSYRPKFMHGKLIAICNNIATEDYSLISASDVKDWCIHTNRDFLEEIEQKFMKDFANMCVIDYLFGNTDRHMENFAFLMDNEGNIVSMSPLFDHNQALLSDVFKTNIDDLFYEPTNTSMIEAAAKYFPYTDLSLDLDALEESGLLRFGGEEIKAKTRFENLQKYIRENELQSTLPEYEL